MQSEYSPIQVIVVDNGNDALLKAWIRDCYPTVLYVVNGENLGFAGGCNVGIRIALLNEAEYVLLINNDMIIGKAGVSKLVEALESNSQCGIVSGLILFRDEPEVIWYAGGNVIWAIGKVRHYGMGRRKENFELRRARVSFVSGAMMLVRASVFREIGLLCEAFFFGAEDAEFCLRAARNGVDCLFEPEALAWHRVGRSRGEKTSPWLVYNSQLNRALLLRAFYGKGFLASFLFRAMCVSNSAKWRLVALLQRRPVGPYLKAIAQAQHQVRLGLERITITNLRTFGGP